MLRISVDKEHASSIRAQQNKNCDFVFWLFGTALVV